MFLETPFMVLQIHLQFVEYKAAFLQHTNLAAGKYSLKSIGGFRSTTCWFDTSFQPGWIMELIKSIAKLFKTSLNKITESKIEYMDCNYSYPPEKKHIGKMNAGHFFAMLNVLCVGSANSSIHLNIDTHQPIVTKRMESYLCNAHTSFNLFTLYLR